jgi:hypothetical protein
LTDFKEIDLAIIESKRACEKHLKALSPDIPTAYEGLHFTPPANAMYQSTQFYIEQPDDPVFGTGYYRENFQFQVFVADVKGKGTAAALTRAELIRQHFKKGTTLFEAGFKILILETPKVAGTAITEDRIVVPVIISAITEVYE